MTATEGQAQSVLEPVLSKIEVHENDSITPVENQTGLEPK
jgi:hypothetical protein